MKGRKQLKRDAVDDISCHLWHASKMAQSLPITPLQLRRIEIPRSPLLELLEYRLGRVITHEHRHYLAGRPVHCGDLLELYRNGSWILGRYEWTADRDDQPTFETGSLVVGLEGTHLLRWPQSSPPQ